jgi:hypothetical protein
MVTALLTNKAYGYPTRGSRRRRKLGDRVARRAGTLLVTGRHKTRLIPPT